MKKLFFYLLLSFSITALNAEKFDPSAKPGKIFNMVVTNPSDQKVLEAAKDYFCGLIMQPEGTFVDEKKDARALLSNKDFWRNPVIRRLRSEMVKSCPKAYNKFFREQ